jgi:hypothetical protein
MSEQDFLTFLLRKSALLKIDVDHSLFTLIERLRY